MSMYKLTKTGIEKCEWFIRECEAKRKEILDARFDTADETNVPTIKDIEDDINDFGLDEEGEYYNSWGVTDHYSSDCISLMFGTDIIEIKG